MNISKLEKQLANVELRFKKAKCNKCAERLFRQAKLLKDKIYALSTKNQNPTI